MQRSLVLPVALLFIVACGDDSPGRHPDEIGGPWDAVPPLALASDTSICPAAYVDDDLAPGTHEGYSVAGQERSFAIFLPDRARTGPRPLVVVFTATGQDIAEAMASVDTARFVARGFIVVVAQANGNGTLFPVWDALRAPADAGLPNPDLDFFDSLVACVAAHHDVDAQRIYLAAHSAGAIFANYVLQRRSELLAGAIVASGVLELTEPAMPSPLDEMFVLVTWGGDDDAFSGEGGDIEVPEFNFVEQASLASRFYAGQAAVGTANCHGMDLGHVYLRAINDWMIDLLLDHPKGLNGKTGLTLDPVPEGAPVVCTTDPFVYEPPAPEIECAAGTVSGCQATCQLIADCGAENATVAPIIMPQLTELGFDGESCTGCIDKCDMLATTTADAEVLTCLGDPTRNAMCGPGIGGALPLVQGIDMCCAGRTDSPYCVEVCRIIRTSDTVSMLVPGCSML